MRITMSKSPLQVRIDKYFPLRPIAFQPGLALAFNSVPVGIFLSQLLYWSDKGVKGGWIYKTVEELKSETGLTRTMQDLAVKKCIEWGVIEYKLAGIPATRHFKINMERLEYLLPSLKKACGIQYINPPNKFVGNPQTITENTQETTANNTHQFLKRNGTTTTTPIVNVINQRYGSSDFLRKSNDFGKGGSNG
jgi:hypothetical protein